LRRSFRRLQFLGAVEFATNTFDFGVAAELDERG
jgi:hypothetical protein